MTWSYSGDPANSDKDAVRFLVGDTDTSEQLVEDEEISWALSQSTTVPGGAAITARGIAALFSRDVDLDVSGGSYSESQRAAHYRQLAVRLDKQAQSAPARSGVSTPAPIVSGIRQSEMETVREDDERVRPAFRRGQFDWHGLGGEHDHHEYH